MHRRVRGFALAAACALALGCASPSAAPTHETLAWSPTAPVEAGPNGACTALHARIHRAEARAVDEAGTWLDAPVRMVESRRLRALHARAARLGCALPRI